MTPLKWHDEESIKTLSEEQQRLFTHKFYLDSRLKELNAKIEHNKVVYVRMIEDRIKLERLIESIEILIAKTKEREEQYLTKVKSLI